MGVGGIFFDRNGYLRWSWIMVLILIAAVLLVVGMTAWGGAVCERKGNSRGVETHYGGWLDTTCYVTTPEGRVLTLKQYDVDRSEVDVKLTDER